MTGVNYRFAKLLWLAALAGCGPAPFQEAEDAVRHGMKDPDSTQFRDVAFCGQQNNSVVRGEVNSKNSYGAYGGFKSFYYDNGQVEQEGDEYPTYTLFKRCMAQMDLSNRALGVKPSYAGNTVSEISSNISLEADNMDAMAEPTMVPAAKGKELRAAPAEGPMDDITEETNPDPVTGEIGRDNWVGE